MQSVAAAHHSAGTTAEAAVTTPSHSADDTVAEAEHTLASASVDDITHESLTLTPTDKPVPTGLARYGMWVEKAVHDMHLSGRI